MIICKSKKDMSKIEKLTKNVLILLTTLGLIITLVLGFLYFMLDKEHFLIPLLIMMAISFPVMLLSKLYNYRFNVKNTTMIKVIIGDTLLNIQLQEKEKLNELYTLGLFDMSTWDEYIEYGEKLKLKYKDNCQKAEFIFRTTR